MIKLISQLKPYSLPVFLITFFILGQAMAELALPTLMSDLVNNGMMRGNTGYILTYGGYMLFVALASTAFSLIGAYLSAKVALGFGRDLRQKVFHRIEHYSLHEFDQLGTASLITRTTNDIVQVQNVLIMSFRMMIFAPIMCVGGIIMALSRDKTLTLILVVVLPLMLLFLSLIAKTVMPAFKAMQKKLDRLNMVLRENLMGIRVIRAFNKTQFERGRFVEANRDLTDTAIKVNRTMAIMQPMMVLFMNGTSIAITWFGGLRIAEGTMQIGDMMAFIQYAMQIMFSFVMVAFLFVMIPRAEVSAERINEVLEMEPEIVDLAGARDSLDSHASIVFEHVTFRYPGAEQPALSDISFQTGPGEITAIIGGTGSGKSTLVNLIPRFYDVEKGRILVDGVNITEVSQETLRHRIGFVPQTAVLFSGTIRENLRYGKRDAVQEEIQHAVEVAQASGFIEDMPEGFETKVAQGGTNLSGGQKQRLSIARALLRQPEIYLFDDSFSALDYQTDARLRSALREEIKNSAVLLVAQRVSTVLDADRILVLDEGKLVGVGTHKELLESCSVYQEIVSSQLSEEEMARGGQKA